MDQGMTASTGGYFDNMQQRFRQDTPAINVRPVPATIAAFLDDMFTDSGVIKPIDDIYIGTHAGGDGFLFVRLFRGAVNAVGDPTDITDYEVIDQAIASPSHPARIRDSMIGYTRGTPPNADPPPTHSVHIKGCNIGRDRFISTNTPAAPFLVRLQTAFGNNVLVTAPKHFHGLLAEINHNGIFEYMEQELIVRTKAVLDGRTWRGFANRAALIDAYKQAHLSYYDGTAIPDADWETLVPRRMVENRGIAMTLPLGRTIENISSVTIHKQFRIEVERVDWTVTPGGSPPTDRTAQLAMLRASIAADPRFASTHAWPLYERRGFRDFTSYFDGHDWRFTVSGNDLVCVGRRVDYTVVQPIVDRTVTPPANRPLIYNFYPGVGSSDPAVLTGLVESDNRFFGRA
jgi:hypothetical protein